MLTVTVRNARLNLSKYLHLVEKSGEEILVRNRTRTVAKIIPFKAEGSSKSFSRWMKELEEFRGATQILDPDKNAEFSSERIIREDRDARG